MMFGNRREKKRDRVRKRARWSSPLFTLLTRSARKGLMSYTTEEVARLSDDELRTYYQEDNGWSPDDQRIEECMRRFGDRHREYDHEGFATYSPDSPIDDRTQVAYMLARRTHDLDYLESGQADEDLQTLSLGSTALWSIMGHFTGEDSQSEFADMTRDKYWEIMYAMTRFGHYLDEMRSSLRAYHKTFGERRGPQPAAEDLLDA